MLAAKGVQRRGQRRQGKTGVTCTGRKDSRCLWGMMLFNPSSHTPVISCSHLTDEETRGPAREPSSWGGGLCGHISGSPSWPSPNCSCPLLFTFLIIQAVYAHYRRFGKCRKAEGNVKYKIIISSAIVPPPLRDLLLTFWYVLSALCFLIHIICDAFNSICWWHRGAAGCASQWTQVPFKKHRSRLSLTP